MRVGLTGGVASGKSTVAALLAEAGAVIVDADRLAREVVEPGTPGLEAVVASFGAGVLAEDGGLDRPALGRLVFGDPDARARLEAIIHPLVRARGAELEEAARAEHGPDALVVHDIPLLAETGRAGEFDAVLVVDAPDDVRIERMVSTRGWTPEEAAARIAAQATREARLAVATHVVENTGTREDLRERVAAVLARLREDAR
ncbi:dephospho-CoA kinase [Nocardioides bruguierae]|uniref:dephospho-CoA kinase n=1 Tax=Nocardioides bruguierae TaxID=2945102 RepID=UPI0020212E33|nr:dephospho-CoA kinase [Nocardioides bruguierae]MCL8024298.1 dephospho-CoA kinase [Nocardioides bruguierae]